MMTRAELRSLLTDFREMVRARGPEELLQVASMLTCYTVSDPQPEANWLFASSARHALRWWRWANRGERSVQVAIYCNDYYVHSIAVWPTDD